MMNARPLLCLSNLALSSLYGFGLLAASVSLLVPAEAQDAKPGTPPTPPASTQPAEDELAVWSRLVRVTTVMIARIDTRDLAIPEIAEAFHGETIWVAIDLPYSRAQPALRLYTKQPATSKLKEVTANLQILQLSEPEREGDFFVYPLLAYAAEVQPRQVEHVLKVDVRPQLPVAVAATGDAPLRCVILPPDYVRDTVRDLLPVLPSKLGGGPSSVLTEGFRWAAMGFDPAASRAELQIQSASEDAAGRLAAHLPVLMSHLLKAMSPEEDFAPAAELIKAEVHGDRITVEVDVTQIALQAAAQRAIRQAAMIDAQNQLKQIALAIHNFESTYRVLPPPAKGRDEQGNPRLSWRVHLLPFLGEAELYRRFRLDEPWDSEHNLPLAQQTPKPFASPSAPQGHTTFVAPVGEGTIFGGSQPITFKSITDGLSNTALVVVVAPEHTVPWSAPEDFAFDPAEPDVGLARDSQGSLLMGTADGAVHRLPGDLPTQTLLNLFQMNDGNPVQW